MVNRIDQEELIYDMKIINIVYIFILDIFYCKFLFNFILLINLKQNINKILFFNKTI